MFFEKKKSKEKYQRFGAPEVNFALTHLLVHGQNVVPVTYYPTYGLLQLRTLSKTDSCKLLPLQTIILIFYTIWILKKGLTRLSNS